MIPRALVQRWWLPALAGIAGIVLIAVTVLLVREWRQRFPVLAPGVYRGLIQGIGQRPIGMLVERLPGQASLRILLNSRDFQPVQVTPVAVDPDEPASAWLPLLVPSGSGSAFEGRALRFVGQDAGNATFAGSVHYSSLGAQGTWTLETYALPERSADTELELWTRLRAEAAGIEHQAAAIKSEIPKQQAEIDQLTRFVTDGEKLKTRAEQKQTLLQKQLADQKIAIQKAHYDLDRTRERLDISQRITGMGKLVSLSRDSLERDMRWFDSFRNAEIPPELMPAIDRGERVKSLLREAEALRKKIAELKKDEAP